MWQVNSYSSLPYFLHILNSFYRFSNSRFTAGVISCWKCYPFLTQTRIHKFYIVQKQTAVGPYPYCESTYGYIPIDRGFISTALDTALTPMPCYLYVISVDFLVHRTNKIAFDIQIYSSENQTFHNPYISAKSVTIVLWLSMNCNSNGIIDVHVIDIIIDIIYIIINIYNYIYIIDII